MSDTASTPPPAKPADPPPLLIPDTGAAALCGVSRASWHRWRAAGKLPLPVRLGRKLLWRRREVELWIEAGCPAANVWAAMQAAANRRRVVG